MSVRLLVAVAASLLVVLGAPYTGQIRGAIQSALPGQYRLILGAVVAVSVVLAVLVAIRRINERRTQRYGALALAIGGGALYAYVTASGNANVDAVERFHLVEYGALTWLYYRVWQARGDLTSIVFPAFATVLVGTFDEGLQWLVPLRVGELRDVLLNAVAIACGLVFSVGLEPLTVSRWRPDRSGRRAFALFGTVTVLALALFIDAVHLGHFVRDPDTGDFFSRYSPLELLDASRDRAARWGTDPPRVLRRLSFEDHYLAEGLWHIQRRNEGDDAWMSWHENRILEKYFGPVLEFPSYSTPSGARWSDEQRTNMAAEAAKDPRPYTSAAHPYPIYLWTRPLFWGAMALVIAALVLAWLAPDR
jgi:hypothetical protein